MHFTNPLFLFALLGLLIPIIIHLFNFRRYKILYFSNTEFVAELRKQTKKESQLKKILILSLRLLAIASLVLAFAQPYLGPKNQPVSGNNTVVIYVDNSFSMENKTDDGTLLHQAKNKAIAIAKSYSQSDNFRLITNDFLPKHQQNLTQEAFIEQVEEIDISPINKTVEQIYSYCSSDIDAATDKNNYLYLISDFQIDNADFNAIKSRENLQTVAISLSANEINNVLIDSAWLNTPNLIYGQPITIYVRLSNFGNTDVEKLPVKLFLNGRQKSMSAVDIESGKTVETALNITLDQQKIEQGSIEIIDNPITFDDKLYFSLQVNEKKRILNIFQKTENNYLKMLFNADSTLDYQAVPIKNINYSTLTQYDLILLETANEISGGCCRELLQYVQQGGSLVLFAPKTDGTYDNLLNNALGVSSFLAVNKQETRIGKINTEHLLYEHVFESIDDNIDLPKVSQYFQNSKNITDNRQSLLVLENGDDFLFVEQIQQGNVYLFTAPLDDQWSSFAKHAIFVPTLLNMALFSSNVPDLYHLIGDRQGIDISYFNINNNQIFELKNEQTNSSFIPQLLARERSTELFVYNQVEKAGNYMLHSKDTDYLSLAFNYSRKESKMTFLSSKEIKDKIAELELSQFSVLDINHKSDAAISKMLMTQGKQLYPIFIFLGLLCLLAEVILLRIFFGKKE